MSTLKSKIRQVLEITKEEDLVSELGKFEEAIETELAPLNSLLDQDVNSPDVNSVEKHMSNVERFRRRVVAFHALASCFLAHCKSDHFKLDKVKGVTEFDRESYQKRLTSGFIYLETLLKGVIDSIDSRVNLCKLQLKVGEEGTPFSGRNR
jgi:hypothetical protein